MKRTLLFMKLCLAHKMQAARHQGKKSPVIMIKSNDMGRFCITIICTFISICAFPQCIVRGEVTDHSGRRISGAAVVIMNAADSVSVAWDYTQDEPFHIRYTNPNNNRLLIYVKAFGYESVYRNLPENATDHDLGRLELSQSSIRIEEVAITADAPIKYRFTAGKNEFEIPRSIGEQALDLNMLLTHIPGLAVYGEEVTVIGRGRPEFTINGQKTRPGELEQLEPKDIMRISIDRMPSARYSKEVKRPSTSLREKRFGIISMSVWSMISEWRTNRGTEAPSPWMADSGNG